VRRIAEALPNVRVAPTDVIGVASSDVEALAFAWLARETIAGRPGNVPEVTGANGPRVLGAIYPRGA
jgi:anhydro-N-acetylmuramic acid kinase